MLMLMDTGKQPPLTFLVGALTPVLEGLLVVLVVSGVLMGSLLPQWHGDRPVHARQWHHSVRV